MSNFIACDADFASAQAVIFGAPFDGTTTFRPGARFGPSAIRADSFGIETYSPYLDRDLSELAVCDGGDLDLPFGNTERVLDLIGQKTAEILSAGKLPVMLGGEHLVTLGALRTVTKKYPDLCILHLDAHTDLREDYMGERLSHSTVMRRAWELVGDGRLYQFGIRSGEHAEFEFAREHTVMRRYDLSGFADTVQKLRGKPIYFSLDLDVLDPSVFPGTGTPEHGGINFTELLNAIHTLKDAQVVACDLCELSPHYDISGSSTAAACKLLRELLLSVTGSGDGDTRPF
jgi:agmatinase